MTTEVSQRHSSGFTRNQILIAIGLIAAICIAFSLYASKTVIVTEQQYEDEDTKEPNLRQPISKDSHFDFDPLFQPIDMSR